MSDIKMGWTELEEETRRMIDIAEQTYEKQLDGCSFKYGTILSKMVNWIGNNSYLADYIEDWFKERYFDVWSEIDKHHLCYNYRTVIELLDISELDNIVRHIINE